MLTKPEQLIGKIIAAIYREYGDELPDNDAGPFIIVFTDGTFTVIKSRSPYHGEHHETIETDYGDEHYYRYIINSRRKRDANLKANQV